MQCARLGVIGHTKDWCFTLYTELRRGDPRPNDQGRGGRGGSGQGMSHAGRQGGEAHVVTMDPRDTSSNCLYEPGSDKLRCK